jgi:hypothetical protein
VNSTLPLTFCLDAESNKEIKAAWNLAENLQARSNSALRSSRQPGTKPSGKLPRAKRRLASVNHML